MPLVVRWRFRGGGRRRGSLSAITTAQWARQLPVGLCILLLDQVIILVPVIDAVGLLVAVAVLCLAAKGIVLWDCILSSHAVVFAFGELLDVQTDLLSQKLGQLLVDAMSPGEIRGQSARTVALVDVDVLVLSIANLDRDCQELFAAAVTLRHFSLARLLHLGEALAELRRLVCVRHVALLRAHARWIVDRAAHHLRRRHLVNRGKPLRKIRILGE